MTSAADEKSRGYFVVVAGPDGVGKTTVARQLISLYPGGADYFHFRPKVLKRLQPFPGADGRSPSKTPDPGPVFVGWLRLLRNFARFWAGYLIRIRPALRRGRLVVADRWAYGYLAQPSALRYGGPRWLAALALRLMPQPTMVVNLSAPPEVIRSRKAELSKAEIESELGRWLALPGRVETFDAMLTPSDIAVSVIDHLESIAHRGGRHG